MSRNPNMFDYTGPDDFRRRPHFYLSKPLNDVGELWLAIQWLDTMMFLQNGNKNTAHWHVTHRVDYNDYILTVQWERNK